MEVQLHAFLISGLDKFQNYGYCIMRSFITRTLHIILLEWSSETGWAERVARMGETGGAYKI